MKKLLFGLFLFTLLVVGTQVHASGGNSICSDTDGGNNSYIFGKVSLTNPTPGVIPTASDQCYSNVSNTYSDSCSGTGCQVMENYCIDFNNDNILDTYNTTYINCFNGCKNGACISTITKEGCNSGEGYSSTTGQACSINTPSITVLTPNGRDMYEVGQQINVTWDSTGIPASSNNIDITLHGYNANGVIVWSKELSSFTLNDGQEKVILPTNLGGVPFGKNFVISVGIDSINNPSPIYDFSDTTFTIGPATDVTNGGCSNGEVYSSTSGQACPKVLEANDGCYGSRYSATTGKACPLSMVTEEGCKNGSIYSYTTGQRCSQVIIQNTDQGCNGTKYSTTTGNMCPIATIKIDEGCFVGQNYSSTTGQRCSTYVDQVDQGCHGTRYSLTTGKQCPVSTTSSVPISRTLKFGTRGDDVKRIQEFLGLNADGVFGRITASKVMEWQASNGLTADGAFGSKSQAKAGFN